MQTRLYPSKPRGFSLVELLVVISVIGIIASIALMTLTNTDENSRIVAAKAQAQRIASTFAYGEAAGAPGFKTANSVDSAITAVAAGSSGAGINKTSFFQLPGVSASMDEDKPLNQQAQHYLGWQSGMLVYDPTGQGGNSASQYSNFEEWVAALNAAMTTFFQSHPGAGEQEFSDYYQSWLAANPQPQSGGELN